MDTGGGAAGAAAGLDPTALAFLVGALGLVVLMAVRSGVFRQALDVVSRWESLEADVCQVTLPELGEHGRAFSVRQGFGESDGKVMDVGLAVWADCVVLARFLVEHGGPGGDMNMQGARMVELGAGLGLASMVAAVAHPEQGLPRTVLITDGVERVVTAARDNVAENLTQAEMQRAGVHVCRLRWGDQEDMRAALALLQPPRGRAGEGPAGTEPAPEADSACFDIIFGSDITYHPAPVDLLLETIRRLSGARTRVVIVHKDRSPKDALFFGELARQFERHDVFTAPATDAASGGGTFCEVGPAKIHVYRQYTGGCAPR